jgi:hypothetical protein
VIHRTVDILLVFRVFVWLPGFMGYWHGLLSALRRTAR